MDPPVDPLTPYPLAANLVHIARAVWWTCTATCRAIRLPDSPTDPVDALLVHWSQRLLRDIQATVTLEGSDRLLQAERTQRPVVLMSNHTSLYDIPVVFASLPCRVRMLGKQELFRIPCLGRVIRRHGFLPIDRRHRSTAQQQLDHAQTVLQAGTMLWTAPEGQRSPNTDLLPFKKGVFIMALKSQSIIVPLALHGVHRILPAGTSRLTPRVSVQVRVGVPIDTQEHTLDRKEDLIATTRASLIDLLT